MSRRKYVIKCAALALIFFVLRLADILSGRVESPSGFLSGGAGLAHIAQLVAALVAAALCARALKKIEPAPPESGGAPGRALLGVTALLTAAASALELYEILRAHPAAHFLMTRAQLVLLGVKQGGFRLAALCAVIGLAAAVWFGASAVKKSFCRSLWLSLAPPLWLSLRAVARFASGPINSNDTVAVSDIMASMALAAALAALARLVVLGCEADSSRRFVWLAALSLSFTGFALPNAVFYFSAHSLASGLAELAVSCASASSALAALGSVSRAAPAETCENGGEKVGGESAESRPRD